MAPGKRTRPPDVGKWGVARRRPLTGTDTEASSLPDDHEDRGDRSARFDDDVVDHDLALPPSPPDDHHDRTADDHDDVPGGHHHDDLSAERHHDHHDADDHDDIVDGTARFTVHDHAVERHHDHHPPSPAVRGRRRSAALA
jgi:hypothetical protein